MKKFMTMVVAAAMALAVAGTAQAALETKGEYRARLWNLSDYLGYMENGQTMDFWDQRLRVSGTWTVSDGVSVNFRGDIREGMFGTDRPQISFDQAYGMVKMPDMPVTITAGRQPVAWGNGMAASADNRDRFKLTFSGPVTVVYAYDQNTEIGAEGNAQDADDNRAHVLGVIGKVAGFKAGVLGVVGMDGNATDEATTYLADVFVAGKVGPADVKAEIAKKFGGNDAMDVSGMGAYVGAMMTAGPAKVGLEFAYASGDDTGTTDDNEGFRHDYHSPFNSVILFNNMDYSGYAGESSTASDAGIGNAWAVKASATVPAGPLSATCAVVYASRLEDTMMGDAEAIGTEIDLILVYPVTDAVKLMLGGGYVMLGDYYDGNDDPWGAMFGTVVNF